MKKLKHEVDSVIVDLIMEHFNIQSFEGLKQNLTGEEFDERQKRLGLKFKEC